MLSDGSMGFCFGRPTVGAGDDVEGLAGEVFGDAFDVGVDDGLYAGSGLDVLEVGGIVHQLFVLNTMCTNLVLYLKKHIFEKSNTHENGCSKQ